MRACTGKMPPKLSLQGLNRSRFVCKKHTVFQMRLNSSQSRQRRLFWPTRQVQRVRTRAARRRLVDQEAMSSKYRRVTNTPVESSSTEPSRELFSGFHPTPKNSGSAWIRGQARRSLWNTRLSMYVFGSRFNLWIIS